MTAFSIFQIVGSLCSTLAAARALLAYHAYSYIHFGVRLSTIFTSRWFALLWAVLVILTAIQFVGSGTDDATQNGQGGDTAALDGLTNDQRQAIANVL